MSTQQKPQPPPIAVDSDKRVVVGLTLPQWIVVIGAIATGGTAYATMAPKSYVDTKHDKLEVALVKMAEQNTTTSTQVAVLTSEMRIIKRLVVAGAALEETYHYEEMEAYRRPRNARSRTAAPPSARPAAAMAQRMGVDPSAPLKGLDSPAAARRVR